MTWEEDDDAAAAIPMDPLSACSCDSMLPWRSSRLKPLNGSELSKAPFLGRTPDLCPCNNDSLSSLSLLFSFLLN